MNTDIPPMAPLPRDQRHIDADHLNLLSIFHFVGAGLAFLGILVMTGELFMAHFIFANPEFWQGQKQTPPPELFFQMFFWIYLFVGAWCVISGVMNLLSGLFLRARRHRTFSMVVAALNCLHIPFGTVLGIFTLVVLSRESVCQLYDSVERTGGATPPLA